MRRSRLAAILAFAVAFGALAGCSLLSPERPVYVAPGEIAELAAPERCECWVTNAETGRRERRTVRAEAGWFVGRPTDEDAARWAAEDAEH
jgi:hypothetical protein